MFFAFSFAASVRGFVTLVRQKVRISAFHAFRVHEQTGRFRQVGGPHRNLELLPLGGEPSAGAVGEQLDDDLLDRPHDPQLGIGGQDLIEANTLRDWEAAPLADQLGAVLPRRVDDAPAATSRSQDRRRQTWMTV